MFVIGISKTSPRLCAGSVEMTRVSFPRWASSRAVAAAMLVLPTPPLPVKRRIRTVD